MPSVLAIEPEFDRAALLRTVGSEQIRGPLTLVDSVDAALDEIERRVPEVILISPLMSPQDEGQLMARLRALPKSVPVQTLITPDLAAPPGPKRWRYGKRRAVVPGACDPAEFIAQVNAYLELTRERRADGPMFRGTDGAERRAATRHDCPRRPLALVNGAEATVIDLSSTGAQIVASSVLVPGRLVDVVVENGDRLVRCRASVIWGSFEAGDSDDPVRYRAGIDFTDGDPIPHTLIDPPSLVRKTVVEAPSEALALVRTAVPAPRERADRLPAWEVPSVSAVRLPWGDEAHLLNLSRTGVLVESSSKFTPGMTASLRICAVETTLVVPARFVRSEVVTVDGRGVRYRAAAMFESAIDLEELGIRRPGGDSTNKQVAEWLRSIAREISEGRDGAVIRSLATVFAEYGRRASA